MTIDAKTLQALQVIARSQQWDRIPIEQLGLWLWALFHFYAWRKNHE